MAAFTHFRPFGSALVTARAPRCARGGGWGRGGSGSESWGSRGGQRPAARSAGGHARTKGAPRGDRRGARGQTGAARQVGHVAARGASGEGGQVGGKVNGAHASGPLDGVCFRARVMARGDTAVLKHLVAVRPNPAKLRRLWRRACASARQVELPGESERVWPGAAKVNGENERESVRSLTAGHFQTGAAGGRGFQRELSGLCSRIVPSRHIHAIGAAEHACVHLCSSEDTPCVVWASPM
ncbi:hypothetical protein MYMAC_001933 [Corallococcus macrosporus DSM 14697]|uniref:Uncharacterized protein n=1 Tax=Corallococcus macrosporus DSM 14697 TaxID=1189310 RepID=A0A250JSJ4_9BACT|nr:hypothetical protein MYMAC_001933 [Corallococcus macrosporus DSM 14697]